MLANPPLSYDSARLVWGHIALREENDSLTRENIRNKTALQKWKRQSAKELKQRERAEKTDLRSGMIR